MKTTNFERAIFFGWYCSKRDCKFCYMSTQKNTKKAKRTKESILAEAILSKNLRWEIEFISGGYDSFNFDKIVELVKEIYKITGKKQWLNIGVLTEQELTKLKPYIQGFCGAVECINKKIHDKVCPSKPLEEIEKTYKICDKLGLKKAMTIVIGIGETIKDFKKLKEFIKKHKIEKITFYSLNPHKGTPFKKSPEIEYYAEWIRKTRKEFPKLHIIAGAWKDKPEYYPELLKAGSNNITKFPAIKYFNSKSARDIETKLKSAGFKLKGTLTKLPKIDWNKEVDKLKLEKELKEKVKIKLKQYVKQMTISSRV